ncbi:MAG: O-antigen ligase family protein [Bacteroidales bacterium]
MHKYLKIKYLFIFLLLIWPPLQVFILKIDGAGRITGILGLLTFLLYLKYNSFVKSIIMPPYSYWGILIIYSCLNAIAIGNLEALPAYSYFFLIFNPLLLMYLVNSNYSYERDTLQNIIILALYLHLILLLVFSGKYQDGRLGIELDANYMALSAAFLVFFLILKKAYNELTNFRLIIYLVLPVIVVFLSGSRTGFGALTILISGFLFSRRSKSSLKNLLYIILIAIMVYFIYDFISTKTYLGERLEMTQNQIQSDNSTMRTNTFLDNFGDRGIFYYLGFDLFKESPIFGIGFNNFKIKSGINTVLHTEYMRQLVEFGIIGFILFARFYYWIGSRLIRIWKKMADHRKITEIYLSGFIAFLFLNLWIFSGGFAVYFSFFAVTIPYILSYTKN